MVERKGGGKAFSLPAVTDDNPRIHTHVVVDLDPVNLEVHRLKPHVRMW